MISKDYIHSNDLCEEFVYESYHILNNIFDEMQKSYIIETEMEESSLFSEYSEDMIPFYEEEEKNVFERIGQKLIDLAKSFVKMIAGIVDKIKGALGGTNKALKDENLKKAMNENPELAKDFLKSVSSGSIKYNDVADFNSLVDEATKLTKQYQSGGMDDRTFSEKMDDALKKFEGKAKTIGSIMGGITAVVTLVSGIQKISEKSSKNCESARENSLKMAKLLEDAENEARKNISNQKNKTTNWSLLAERNRQVMLATGKGYSNWAKLTDKMYSAVAKFTENRVNNTAKKPVKDNKVNRILGRAQIKSSALDQVTKANDALDKFASYKADYKSKSSS